MARTGSEDIPRYYLYGDRAGDVERDFLHVEPLIDRSDPHGWRIGAHAHPDHMQIMLIHGGGGALWLEDRRHPIPVPALLVLPAGAVHQFAFDPGTDGYVVTAALGWLTAATATDPRLAEAAARPAVLALDGSDAETAEVIAIFAALLKEFVWQAPGRRSAIMAHYQRLLVTALRLGLSQTTAAPAPGDRDQDLLMRYRALIERHFRDERSPAAYAARLAVTPARLNAACKARSNRTATEILHDRILLEAKRSLLYTDHGVAAIAHMTGFDDPAYFSRFFARRVGMAPGAYRKTSGRA